MHLFAHIGDTINKNHNRNVFLINGITYTYLDFAKAISKIRWAIQTGTGANENILGVVANDDIETYAAIFALWLEGKAYVPLEPNMPRSRNENIIQQAFIETIIDSSAEPLLDNCKLIASKKLAATAIGVAPKEVSDKDLAYILFTSGTTGQPKGVPITRANLAGFVTAFDALGFDISENDRCLQMFELTFDLSVMSYLIPILKGACIYTIPKNSIKYLYIYELMEEQQLTVALMVPSILQNLRSYFNEIELGNMRYSLFCGEALAEDVTAAWSKCVPNAVICNVYGPTEDTIFCTCYTYNKTSYNKSYNGLLSVGKAMQGSFTIIVDEQNNVLPFDNTGELCLGGIQLTPGYWNNAEKNKEAFFIADYNGKKERFYKTGDICRMDAGGDILYTGRLDYQIKVQGFRVELSEIEFHARSFLKNINAVAVAITNSGNTEIGLVIESKAFDSIPVCNYMKAKMPVYMIPKQVLFIESFPLNVNGKTDRNKLRELFKQL